MTTVRRAVIDVGTNSVKLLVGELGVDGVQPLFEKSEQTRLGRGFYDSHILLSEPIAQTAKAVAKFASLARDQQASSIRVVATSAARDAANRADLIRAIEETSQLKVEIISGDDEAQMVFRGVTSDPKLLAHQLLILDVGGGSTEFIIGEGKQHQFRQSFNLGTVRLIEDLRPGDPPAAEHFRSCRARLRDFVETRVAPVLGPKLGDVSQLTLVGTGGTTTILARMEKGMSGFVREEIEGTRVSRERIVYWMDRLWTTSVAERCEIVGIPSNRADIIPMGVAIYEAVMNCFNLPSVFVSTRGLRFGALMQSNE